MEKYSVVIVEDHTLLSQAIAGVVNDFEKFQVSYLCKNGKELVEKFEISTNIPNLVLMDVNMPIMNGIETTEWLKKHHPNVNVLALTVEENEVTILKMIRAGAKGYLLKDIDKKTLEKALLKIMDTGVYYSNSVNEVLINSVNGRNIEFELKNHEIEFLKYICSELTYKEIAEKMNVSPKTVDGYRDHLFTKLDAKNRIGLVLYAIKHKIFNQ